MKTGDSLKKLKGENPQIGHISLRKQPRSTTNLFISGKGHSEANTRGPGHGTTAQQRRQAYGSKIQTKVVGHAGNQNAAPRIGSNMEKQRSSNAQSSSKTHGLAQASRSGSRSRGSDRAARTTKPYQVRATPKGTQGTGMAYTQKFKKYRPSLQAIANPQQSKSNNNIQKENGEASGGAHTGLHPKSHEKKMKASSSLLFAFKKRNAPQTQQPSANASNSSSQNLLPGARQRHLISSQSSTIKNFKSINNTDSVEKYDKTRFGGGNGRTSSQKRTIKDEPPRPRTSMHGLASVANDLAQNSAPAQNGWSTQRQLIVPKSRALAACRNNNHEVGSEPAQNRSESNSMYSQRQDRGPRGTDSNQMKYTASRVTLNSQEYPYDFDAKPNEQIGQVMYDSVPRVAIQEEQPQRQSPFGRGHQDDERKNTKACQPKVRAPDKEGTVSSSQGESCNRPNINERLRRTSELALQSAAQFGRQQQSYELYLKAKEEVLVTPGQQQSTMRSGASYDPSGQPHETELTTRVLGAGGVQQMVRVGQIPKFERSPPHAKLSHAHELPKSIVCFQGMPKCPNAGSFQSSLRNNVRMQNNRSNEDFQTPRSRMNLVSRNQVNTQRQGSQHPPNTTLDLFKDGQKSMVSSLGGEKLSNVGAVASNYRSGPRLETVSLNQTPRVASSTVTANRPSASQRKSLPFLVQSKSLSQSRVAPKGIVSRTISNESISQISQLSLQSQRRRKALAQQRQLHSAHRLVNPRLRVGTGTSLNQSSLVGKAAQRSREAGGRVLQKLQRGDKPGGPSRADDLPMKLIEANNRESSRCAQNHKTKYRSSRIQGILRKVGVSTSSSAGQKAKDNKSDDVSDSQKETMLNGANSKAHRSAHASKDTRKESRRQPSNGQQTLPQDMTFFFGGPSLASHKPEMVTFQKLDPKRAPDSLISSIISPQYSSLRTPVMSQLQSPRAPPPGNAMAAQDSPLVCPAILNSSLRSPKTNREPHKVEMFGDNLPKQGQSRKPSRFDFAEVYLALYDEDLSVSKCRAKYPKLPEIHEAASGRKGESSSLVQLPHLRLCFDTALSDYPFVQPTNGTTEAAELASRAGAVTPPGSGDSGLRVRMQKLSHASLANILKCKALGAEGREHCQRLVCEEADGNIFVKWDMGAEGERDILKYVEDRDNGRLVDDDDSSKLDHIISKHIKYLHYNCAKQLPFKFEGLPIYIITNDQSRLPLTIGQDHEVGSVDVDRGNSWNSDVLIDDTLDLINRYHLFSRIKDRAGAPTMKKLAEVRNNHQSMLQSIVDGLLESAAYSGGSPLTWQEAFDYVSACRGVQVMFEAWQQKHREAKARQREQPALQDPQAVQETIPDQIGAGLKVLSAPLARQRVTSESQQSLHPASPPVQMPQHCPQTRLQTEQGKRKFSRAPALPGQALPLDSTNSRVDFTLTSNTHGTQGTLTQRAKEEVEDVYMPQTVLDQSRLQSDSHLGASRNIYNEKMASMNSKKLRSSAAYEKAQASESTSRNAKAEMDGSEDQIVLRRAGCVSQVADGQHQNTHGTQSRSSVHGHDERHQIINNHLLASTSQSNCSFEEKNFQNHPSPSEHEVRSTDLGERRGQGADQTDMLVSGHHAEVRRPQREDDDDGARPRLPTSDAQDLPDLHDLSRSLVNSYMLNENLRTMIHERIKTFHHQSVTGTEGQSKNKEAVEANCREPDGRCRSKIGKTQSCADTQTFSSSEKIYVLNRFNDLQFQKQSSASLQEDEMKVQESPIFKLTGLSSVDGRNALADLFRDQLLQMTQENLKSQESQHKMGNSELLCQQLGSIIEFNKSLQKNERPSELSRQLQRDLFQYASIPNPRIGTDELVEEAMKANKEREQDQANEAESEGQRNGPLPFREEAISSSLSLRRQSKEELNVQDHIGRTRTQPGDLTPPAQATLIGHRQPILIRDLGDRTPKSDGKRAVPNDLLAILRSVLRKSQIQTVNSRGQQLSSVDAPDDDHEAKRQYERVFSGLEDLLASLKREYHQRFQGKGNQENAMNQQEDPSGASSNSEIDQQDFDEGVKTQDGHARKSSQKKKGIREQLAEYGSVKSVKVVDMSASDINEPFLSNIALIRRLSTFKNSKAVRKSFSGAPEVQVCSLVEPRNELFGESINKMYSKAASIAIQEENSVETSVRVGSKVSEATSCKQRLDEAQDDPVDRGLVPTSEYEASQKRTADHHKPEAVNVPLAKIDLTLDNIDPASATFVPVRQQQPKRQCSTHRSKFRKQRGVGADDKENKV